MEITKIVKIVKYGIEDISNRVCKIYVQYNQYLEGLVIRATSRDLSVGVCARFDMLDDTEISERYVKELCERMIYEYRRGYKKHFQLT